MNDQIAVERFSVSVIPEWLYSYLIKRGLSEQFLLEDCVLDERVSVDDLATIILLNSGFVDESKKGPCLSTYQLTSDILRNRITGKEDLEVKITAALNLSFSNRLKQELQQSLSAPCDDASLSYDFVVTGPKIWLVVKPGFLSCFEDSVSTLKFYRDYLSAVGQIASIGSVHQTEVFKWYVRELAA